MFENLDIDKSLKNARMSLLIMIALTVLNIAGILIGTGTYLPYSAIIPYAIVFFSSNITVNTIIASSFFLLFYGGVTYMSNKKEIWLIGALLMYLVDSLVMIFFTFANGFEMMQTLELVFHGWILWTLLKGSVAAYRNLIS